MNVPKNDAEENLVNNILRIIKTYSTIKPMTSNLREMICIIIEELHTHYNISSEFDVISQNIICE